MIDAFSGDYRFLSNFFVHDIEFEGITYPCLECAYQAAKTKAKKVRRVFAKLSASDAKTIGGVIPIRRDWEDVKVGVMEALLRIKFSNPTLRKMLSYTENHELVEGNWWGDTFWGVCKGVGENNLGKLLMKIRDEGDSTEFVM